MFTHLHVHSHYSLLDGMAKIDELIEAARENKMRALALTDHGALYGTIEFYKKANQAGIKPIIGSEIYIAPHGHLDKKTKIDTGAYHLVLLVKNEEGYKNLIRLVTLAHLEGFYYKPRIDFELLKQHKEGLIALTACCHGEIPQLIIKNQKEKAEKKILDYRELFNDDFYLEVQHHPKIPEQEKINQALYEFSKKYHLPLVATNDVHYLRPDDAEVQDILLCLQTKKKKNDKDRLSMLGEDFSFRSQEEMISVFKDHPEAIKSTAEIVNKCNLEIKLGEYKLPYFPLPPEKTAEEYLEEMCEKRISSYYPQETKEVRERLEYEIGVIKKTGFAPYFLIVQDFVNWAKRNKIIVGPGRGCLLPNTKILLKDGKQKNIQDIKPGERVITSFGNKRKVKKILSYPIDEEIAIIKSKMPAFNLKLTKDHKVLAAKHKMCPVKSIKDTICKPSCNRSCKRNLWGEYKLEWIKVQDLQKNDFLVYPIVKHSQKKIKLDLLNFNCLDTHLKGNNKYVWYEIGTNQFIQKKIKRYIKLNKNFAELLGFYIAEGWSRTRRKYREATIGFSFHQNEKEYREKVKKLLKQIFGLESSIKFHKTKKSCQVLAYSRIVAKFLERLCGKGSQNKHIPYQIFESSNEIVISLLTTLFKGDGSRKDKMRISFDSISFDLVSQIKMLLARLGIMSSIKIRKFKEKKWHYSYKLTVSGKQLFDFNKIFKEFKIPIKKQKFYRNDTFIWQNYIWFPVKEISFERYKGKVYDLTVDKDVSYVTNDITVHNSAAGSIVSYILGITDIDPLKYELIFERFLNPERISMPDIDLDFADTRRDEVLNYITEKYGQDHVAQIITFGTMASRAAIRDVGRVLDYPYSFCDKLAKLVPMGLSLGEALKTPDLKHAYESNKDVMKIIDFSKKLEGVARHASRHACGVVITPAHLTEYVPLQYDVSGQEKAIITQYEMHSIEDLGLLKIDLLGLKNLTLIEAALNIIKRAKGKEIKIEEVPLDDQKTYALLRKGETTGVFQMESEGFRRYLKQLKPTNIEDLIAMVALYRPGPMELIAEYIAGKHGKKEARYLHPKLKPILEKTFGICVFQEQVLQIAKDLAGFSLAEADVLRKAVGKKIVTLLKEQKNKFINGCIKNKISKEVAEKIFAFIEPFAGYAFNRSHSACYAFIAYWTAYLKANYPLAFMAALLTSDQNDLDRIAIEVEEARRMGIEILPPDINESYENFTAIDDKIRTRSFRSQNLEAPIEQYLCGAIRFGLLAIKNIGQNVVKDFLKEREENGNFTNLEDFLSRLQPKDINKKTLESLIKSGALDKFEERKCLLENLEYLLSFSKKKLQDKENGQKTIFAFFKDHKSTLHLKKVLPATSNEKLFWEKELLGLFISRHPLEEYAEIIKKYAKPITEIQNNSEVKIIGLVSEIKKILTGNKENMLFVKVEDPWGKIEIIVFPKLASEKIWQKNKIVFIAGRTTDKDGEIKVIAERVKAVSEEGLKNLLIKNQNNI